MEPLPPKPPREHPETPPASEEPPAASSGTALPETAPPPEPPEPATEADAYTCEDAEPHTESEGLAPEAAATRRPRGRTSLILAAAALLGVVAGVATGYTVQADRAPTPLPPLSQAKLSYPDESVPEGEWEPIPAEHDRRVKTDGDLRKLLVDRPKGARDREADPSPDGWVPLSAYVREYKNPDHMFDTLVSGGVRRVAGAEWRTGRYQVTVIRLVQFHGLESRFAVDHARSQRAYMSDDEHAGSPGQPLKGSSNGRYFVDEAPARKPGYLPNYANRAIAHRGDIMMDVWIYDTSPVSEKKIRELAERQLERL